MAVGRIAPNRHWWMGENFFLKKIKKKTTKTAKTAKTAKTTLIKYFIIIKCFKY